jgi:hypothetical protein
MALSQEPLPNNTQHLQEKDIHTPGAIRTHNLSNRAASDPRLRLPGHWDLLMLCSLPLAKILYLVSVSVFAFHFEWTFVYCPCLFIHCFREALEPSEDQWLLHVPLVLTQKTSIWSTQCIFCVVLLITIISLNSIHRLVSLMEAMIFFTNRLNL